MKVKTGRPTPWFLASVNTKGQGLQKKRQNSRFPQNPPGRRNDFIRDVGIHAPGFNTIGARFPKAPGEQTERLTTPSNVCKSSVITSQFTNRSPTQRRRRRKLRWERADEPTNEWKRRCVTATLHLPILRRIRVVRGQSKRSSSIFRIEEAITVLVQRGSTQVAQDQGSRQHGILLLLTVESRCGAGARLSSHSIPEAGRLSPRLMGSGGICAVESNTRLVTVQ
ncbi:uncharacterized protein N7459_002052 [Penicillium hispanicum]|uniref:uncharacterized protein n=1 Tax=Penicillium hispanicum TaxID=1080232 RepID=UPI0025416FA8|nr:uncharacterized protein N7459_002052 [Penicillium hispanicum]KAJ5591683.1 hypothetical protein N7459_002052 [Penicillium hispanicum]